MADLYCPASGSVCNLACQREYSAISPRKLQGVISVSVQPSLTANRASSEPPTYLGHSTSHLWHLKLSPCSGPFCLRGASGWNRAIKELQLYMAKEIKRSFARNSASLQQLTSKQHHDVMSRLSWLVWRRRQTGGPPSLTLLRCCGGKHRERCHSVTWQASSCAVTRPPTCYICWKNRRF